MFRFDKNLKIKTCQSVQIKKIHIQFMTSAASQIPEKPGSIERRLKS